MYAGPKAFSEKETLALSEFLKTLDIKLYLDFHSYGQLLMFPTVSISSYFRFSCSILIFTLCVIFVSMPTFRVILKNMYEIMMIW